MKLAVIGAGYVGLISGVGFAGFGNQVTCIEKLESRVQRINSGDPVIFEEGLHEKLASALASKNFHASVDYSFVKDADVVMICVGTPSREDGRIDLSYVKSAAESIGDALKGTDKYVSVVVKSTVVPGTTMSLKQILEDHSGKKQGVGFGLGMVPEFLREGCALEDFNSPDRVVLGSADEGTAAKLRELHSIYDCPKFETNPSTAEAIKYASNGFLATKISFVNELANACEKFGVNVDDVAKGMGLDKRIGSSFLTAGLGFGGSCFTKDASALLTLCKSEGVCASVLDSALKANYKQPLRMFDLAKTGLSATRQSGLDGKVVALLGLAFKPNTDDVRDSPSLILVKSLLAAGVKIKATDPKAIDSFKAAIGELAKRIEFCPTAEEAVKGANIVMLATNWPEFKKPLGEYAKLMSGTNSIFIDAWRNYSSKDAEAAGIVYLSIGGEFYYGKN